MGDLNVQKNGSEARLSGEDLERAVYDTIRYFGILGMPVTCVQIWRSLIVDRRGKGKRWHGRRPPRLQEVKVVLANSKWLRAKVGRKWGYYFPRSVVEEGVAPKQHVRAWLLRHARAQMKLRQLKRYARWLAMIPLVEMIGLSGSLAMFNAKQSSDWDLLIIAKRDRVWSARLLMLAASQLMGRRRKHWDEVAPDKLCLNHYISDGELMMAPEVRNLCGAQTYLKVVPVYGVEVWERWRRENEGWINRWIMHPETPVLPPRMSVEMGWLGRNAKRGVSLVLEEVPGDVLERAAKYWQERIMARHAWPAGEGRVAVSDKELAFHPDSKIPGILRQLEEEDGQQRLW